MLDILLESTLEPRSKEEMALEKAGKLEKCCLAQLKKNLSV